MTAATTYIYRSPGREAPRAPVPRPSARRLVAPIGLTLAVAGAIVTTVLVWCWASPEYLGPADRFVPAVGYLENGAALLLLASPALLVQRIVTRVVPSWSGLSRAVRVLYVLLLVALQLGVVVGGEIAMLSARKIRLFAPHLVATSYGPGGRSAHVYTRESGCGFDVFVSKPFSITTTRAYEISRAQCGEPMPKTRWTDGRMELLGDDGAPLKSEPSPSFCLFCGC